VRRDHGDGSARRMFGFSILYLFALFALLIVDRAPGLAPGFAAGLAG
jgi:protoheme IX farnesyltransferase